MNSSPSKTTLPAKNEKCSEEKLIKWMHTINSQFNVARKMTPEQMQFCAAIILQDYKKVKYGDLAPILKFMIQGYGPPIVDRIDANIIIRSVQAYLRQKVYNKEKNLDGDDYEPLSKEESAKRVSTIRSNLEKARMIWEDKVEISKSLIDRLEMSDLMEALGVDEDVFSKASEGLMFAEEDIQRYRRKVLKGMCQNRMGNKAFTEKILSVGLSRGMVSEDFIEIFDYDTHPYQQMPDFDWELTVIAADEIPRRRKMILITQSHTVFLSFPSIFNVLPAKRIVQIEMDGIITDHASNFGPIEEAFGLTDIEDIFNQFKNQPYGHWYRGYAVPRTESSS
jgi:hypothetical protein